MSASQAWRATLASIVLLAGAAGCSTSGGTGAPSTSAVTSPSSSASSTPSPDQSAVAAEAGLTAYRGYRQALNAALSQGNPQSKELARFAADKALAEARANLLQLQRLGIVYTGKPTISPSVSRVALDAARPTVELNDCVDNTNWVPVYKATGRSAAAPGQNRRVPLTASVQLFNGAWRVMAVQSDRSRTC